jgi:DNA repair protein RecO (recombination protein O)
MIEEEKSEGIVLKSLDYKERQRIVTVFTKNFGLISLIFNSISRRNARMLSLSTSFCIGEFVFSRGRSELFRFQDGSVANDMFSLRSRFAHLQAAGAIAQAVLCSQLPGKPAPELYSLMESYLKQIPHFDNPSPLASSFILKLLKHEGMLVLSDHCSLCGSPTIFLSQGESLCRAHAQPGSQSFTSHELEVMQLLLSARRFDQLHAISLDETLSSKIPFLLSAFKH